MSNRFSSLRAASRVLKAYKKPVAVTLRTRLRGEVYNREGELERVFYSLNEFIVNRGISGVLSTLEVGYRPRVLGCACRETWVGRPGVATVGSGGPISREASRADDVAVAGVLVVRIQRERRRRWSVSGVLFTYFYLFIL